MPDLNAVGSFQSGVGIADSIIGRRQAQEQLGQEQQKLDFQNQQATYKQKQEEAKREIYLKAYNDHTFFPELAARDPEGAEKLAKLKDRENKTTAGVIDHVLTAPVEERDARWKQAKSYLEQQGVATDHLGDDYSPELAKELQGYKKQISTWDDTFKTIETDRGLALQSEKTGAITPTDYGVYKKPPSTVVNVGGEQPAFRKKLEETYGTKLAERIDQIQTNANNAIETKQYLALQKESLNNLPNTGPLDSGKILFGNLANQFGVDIDMSKVSSLEQLSAAAKTITIPLVKKLGINPTDADARLIAATIADIGKGKATNEQLNSLLDQASDKQIEKANIVDRLRSEGKEEQIPKALREYDAKSPIKLNPQGKTADKNSNPANYSEGATATNPKTGQTLTFRGGKWQ